MRRAPIRVSALVIVLLAACSPGTASTSTAEATTTTVEQATTTAALDTTTTSTVAVPAEETVQVLFQPFSELGGLWSELFLPYGEAEDQLGTSPGGDGLILGPEFGTQTPDGNYWILDAAKQRAAVFSADGTYLEQVVFPEENLHVVRTGRFRFQGLHGTHRVACPDYLGVI